MSPHIEQAVQPLYTLLYLLIASIFAFIPTFFILKRILVNKGFQERRAAEAAKGTATLLLVIFIASVLYFKIQN